MLVRPHVVVEVRKLLGSSGQSIETRHTEVDSVLEWAGTRAFHVSLRGEPPLLRKHPPNGSTGRPGQQ